MSILDEEKARLIPICKADGDAVRDAGGLYVLGTERHESRRIDNQLRGRAGRQGDPGESRFYLSLGDDLMRLFATGAMNWVMGRALPDDVPIEAKMVTKAIERAQTTVEARNAEIRKNVLKYDEVMNEQRKVIYAKRRLILDGGDLHDQLLESLEKAVGNIVDSYCSGDAAADWDVDGLHGDIASLYPTEFDIDDLRAAGSRTQLKASFLAEAKERYAEKEERVTSEVMREIERNVLLQLVDQRWREHLSDMDYLEEGINLRAMGQKDPLVEWQREGYEMFGHLVRGADDRRPDTLIG
jgi:preprotein translocase subunit SecA